MRSAIFGATDDDPGAGPSYAYLNNHSLVNWSSDLNLRAIALSDDCAVTEFTVIVDTAPGGAATRTYAICYGDGTPAATVTLTGAETTKTTLVPASFLRFDEVVVKQTATGSPAAPGNTFWYVFVNTVGNKSFVMGGGDAAPSNTVTNYSTPFGTAAWTTSAVNQDVPNPTGMTITSAVVRASVGPDLGDAYAVSMRINNTTDALTVSLQDFAAIDGVTGSQALAAGDDITIKCVPTGTPSTANLSWCYTFEPTINGESIDGYGTATTLSTTNTQFNQPQAQGNAWSTTETGRQLKIPGVSLKKLFVRLHAAPGGVASRTHTMRVAGADSTLTVQITGAALTGSDTTHTVAVTAGQAIGMKSVPTGVPAAAQSHFGYVIVTTQPAPQVAKAYVY